MGRKQDRKERMRLFLSEPESLDSLCEFIADRGTLAQWCHDNDINYRTAYDWLHANPDNLNRYTRALEARHSRLTDRVVTGLVRMAEVDPRKAFDGNSLLPVNQLPDDVALAVSSIDLSRNDDGDITTKLRLNDRGRGFELLGRHLGMFRDKVEMSGVGGGPLQFEMVPVEQLKARVRGTNKG